MQFKKAVENYKEGHRLRKLWRRIEDGGGKMKMVATYRRRGKKKRVFFFPLADRGFGGIKNVCDLTQSQEEYGDKKKKNQLKLLSPCPSISPISSSLIAAVHSPPSTP